MTVLQVCVHCDGGDGAAAAGLSLSEHQPAGGEFPQHAASAAGGRQTTPAHPRHQLCEYYTLYCNHTVLHYISEESIFTYVYLTALDT